MWIFKESVFQIIHSWPVCTNQVWVISNHRGFPTLSSQMSTAAAKRMLVSARSATAMGGDEQSKAEDRKAIVAFGQM
jgi:hypothetical protein